MPTQIGTRMISPRGDHTRQAEESQVEFYGPDRNHPDNHRLEPDELLPYWPGGGRLMGDGQPLLIAPQDHTLRPVEQAGNGQLGFSGVARDGNNSPVGGMTVRLFRTADSSLVATVVSRADGSYNISTPYAGEDHFIVCHKSGSPELAGASQTTLQPW